MEASEVIEQSCFFISNITCYDIAKDFAGPIIAVAVAFFTVKYALVQLARQHKNNLDAQKEENKLNTRIELFKDMNSLLDAVSAIIREVSSQCMVKKYSNLNVAAELNSVEYLTTSEKLNRALLAVVSKVESHEIVNLKLFRTFRYSLQAIVQDIMELQFHEDRVEVLEKIIELTSDASCYLGDFQVCMQNFAYGEIFDSEVPNREPVDSRLKVITNNPLELDELMEYFLTETNWGIKNQALQAEAEAEFSSNQDQQRDQWGQGSIGSDSIKKNRI